MKQGIYTGLSNPDYHSKSAYSKSQLDHVSNAPGLLSWSKKAPSDESSAAALVGTALHTLLLEPNLFESQYAIEPTGLDRRTKVGKANAELFEQEVASKGLIVLTSQEWDMLQAQRDSVMAHAEARALLESKQGKAELSVFWQDPDTGLECRCRPDWWAYPEVLLDVKTTDDPSAWAFGKSTNDYRYHVQDSFYSDGCSIASGTNIEEFLFLAIGKKRELGRYPVRLYRLNHRAKDLGRDLYKKDLNTILTCQTRISENQAAWPAIENLDLPHYAYHRQEF